MNDQYAGELKLVGHNRYSSEVRPKAGDKITIKVAILILKSKRVRKRGNNREKPIVTKILAFFPSSVFRVKIGT